jgi:hypothetical protein
MYLNVKMDFASKLYVKRKKIVASFSPKIACLNVKIGNVRLNT